MNLYIVGPSKLYCNAVGIGEVKNAKAKGTKV